jgi:hypothetical protein
LARIVALYWTTDGTALKGAVSRNEEEERALLQRFWSEHSVLRPTYVGFNILDFDLPLMIRRSQYLGVTYPHLELGRYRHPSVVDLMQILTFDGKVPYRRLEFYCRRFGIVSPIEDKFSGADVPTLVMSNRWDDVRTHCAADVLKEWLLGVRLGVIDQPQEVSADQPF